MSLFMLHDVVVIVARGRAAVDPVTLVVVVVAVLLFLLFPFLVLLQVYFWFFRGHQGGTRLRRARGDGTAAAAA